MVHWSVLLTAVVCTVIVCLSITKLCVEHMRINGLKRMHEMQLQYPHSLMAAGALMTTEQQARIQKVMGESGLLPREDTIKLTPEVCAQMQKDLDAAGIGPKFKAPLGSIDPITTPTPPEHDGHD